MVTVILAAPAAWAISAIVTWSYPCAMNMPAAMSEMACMAKDSIVSSVIAIAILAPVAAHRPLMSAGLKPS
ncbi:MAG TPA: hypothetical protein VMH35_20260 [Streptosporangiaceae bacterium]|nr:hypothetical protein [Streptosporangiaceae bacterium]